MEPQDLVYISGLYSGPSPSAGLGVARSLRTAFPTLRLVGVDYWAGSSGLHDPIFDDTWLLPSWDLIDERLYAARIKEKLDAGAYWISTLDMELEWLTERLGGHPRLLAPSRSALRATGKNEARLSELLPFCTPAKIGFDAPAAEVYRFARHHSFRVWVKGPHHDAIFVSNHRQLEAAREALEKKWGNGPLTLQAHVRGTEESICIAAVNGKLVDAVQMTKRITTPDGKTWAGRIANVPEDVEKAVTKAFKTLEWTGGAEIELLRDADDDLWLMECNPRFPAWIFGATLAGRNLPAELFAHAVRATAPVGASPTRKPPRIATVPASPEFTRVVMEIPVRSEFPLPVAPEPHHGQITMNGKYGAGLSSIAALLRAPQDAESGAPHAAEATAEVEGHSGIRTIARALPVLPASISADLRAAQATTAPTPARVFLASEALSAFTTARQHAKVAVDGCRLRVAYSVKTCPEPRYLAMARESGLLAECISQLEVKRALEAGYSPHECVLNGPGKWWPTDIDIDGLAAVFADSAEELEELVVSARTDTLWGVRLRLPGFGSRFGIDISTPAQFDRVIAALASMPRERKLGVHVHMASTLIGNGHWLDATESAVSWAKAIEETTGRAVTTLDFGGGYHPEDFAQLPWPEIVGFARSQLSSLEEIMIEPGRALTQSTEAVITRVLDVRRNAGRVEEVVVDASIAELPLASAYPHRFARLHEDGRVTPIAHGSVKLLGRICMEDDCLSTGLHLDNEIKRGDRIVVCDAGAYERSMSYGFGRGGYSQAS